MGVDPTGRVMLPAGAWRFVGAWGRVGVVTRGRALVLSEGGDAEVNADGRGRVTLPAWLRSACGAGDGPVRGSVLVAVRRPVGDVAVIAPVNVLDAVAADLVGEVA